MIKVRLLMCCCFVLCTAAWSVASDNNKEHAAAGPNKYQTIDTSLMNRVTVPAGTSLVDVLVLLQDTVYGSASQIAMKRADNDTAFKHISQQVTGVASMLRDTTQATFPSLRAFRTVILIETSFIGPSFLQRAQRDSLKAFLNAGSPGNEKSLIVFGGDFAYNYDRSSSSVIDTALSRILLKHQYLLDDGNVPGQNKMRGLAINNSLTDSLVVNATNFYPDAVRKLSGADSLYGYTGRGIRDSIGGVGYNGASYNAAVIFSDPRYITAKAGDFTGGFKRVLAGVLTYIRNAGGVTDVEGLSAPVADSFELMQNYPNPFNPTTMIRFQIPRYTFVTLKVFDVLGREVATVAEGTFAPGTYSRTFNAASVSSGVYFYRLRAASTTSTKRMVLMK